jgi:DNA (cytosine-5)-methyltransferase 1
LAENVSGILTPRHFTEFMKIIEAFKKIGYNVSYKLLDAQDYGVPQERKRNSIIGLSTTLNRQFILRVLCVRHSTVATFIYTSRSN